MSKTEKLYRLIHYYNFLGSALPLEDAQALIEDFKIENIKESKIIFKEGFLTLDERYALERKRYAEYNKKLFSLSITLMRYLMKFSKAKLICITGSLAYGDARPWQDIDLMVIGTRKNLMITLMKIFILNRKLKLLGFKANLCVNFASSIEDFYNVLEKNCSRLAAFDLIKAIPSDEEIYNYLIKNNSCLKKFFKISINGSNKKLYIANGSSYSLLNIFIYLIFFFYFSILNKIRNLRLLKKKYYLKLFKYELSLNYFQIKSNKYEILKKMFERIF